MPDGYIGKILRVDLSSGTLKDEPLPDESVLRKYVGGKGLALWYLARETTPDMKSGDPEVPLIFMTGPLAGTTAPSSADYCIASLHFSIPYAPSTSHSHGFWAAYMRFAGYDGIIFTGASPEPVYLWVNDGKPELRDAAHLWGKGTRETETTIKREVGDPGRISVACIGPGGENLIHGGSVKNDFNHGAHKGSPGSLMGSKRLKAIAVHGNATIPLADPARYAEATGLWSDRLEAKLKVRPGIKNGGILMGIYGSGAMGFASKNLTDPLHSEALQKAVARDVPSWTIEPQGSFNCTISCAYNAKITTGACAGFTAQLDGGGENLEPGAMIGVEDPGAMVMLADYWDDIGVDSAVPGAMIAAVFDMYNQGLISSEDVDGLDLSWGNYEAAMELMEKTLRREGVGAKLALGMKEGLEAIHPDGAKFLVHVKGAGINLHDWRKNWHTLFGEVVAGAGPSWQASGTPEAELAPPPTDPFDPEGKAQSVKVSQPTKVFEDSLGVCMFATGVEGRLDLLPQAVATATGWTDFDREEALEVGERITNLMRLIAVSRGFKKEDEFDVGPQLVDTYAEDPKAALGPHLPRLVDEYYGLMGWDVATGRPKPETIRRLGLEEFAGAAGAPA